MTDSSLILWAQGYASPALTAFLKAVTSLGSLEFYMLAIPIIYWVIDKHFGFRFAVFFSLSAYVNSGVKHIFRTARPPLELRQIIQEGYSFPSGHAQGSAAFWGFIALEMKELWASYLALLMVALISFSRIYLGVHWPIDILGGIGIGLVLLLFYNRLASLNPNKAPLPAWILGSLALAALLFLIHPAGDGPMTAGFLLGALLGYRLELLYVDFQEEASLIQNMLKVGIGLGLLFGLRLLLKPVTAWLPGNLAVLARYTLLGLWASLGAPFLFMKLGFFKAKPFGYTFH
ncbi:MAG: phosphatase PAP2 family protein [Firmicutes bacterium]|nr:phosphatase PAP2 family protein [Bacillota bacterium]